MTFLSCACGKRYDVTARAPGARVRCNACAAVLVVPAPRASEGAASASERLRRARGEPCARHPKAIAGRACDECHQWMCEACRAPRPATHLCRTCAARVAATRAIPLDFGLLATPAMAARLGIRALPRVIVFNAAANAIKFALIFLMMIPAVAAGKALEAARTAGDPTSFDTALWTALLGVAIGLILAVSALFDVVVVPSADIFILDGTLRNTGEGFMAALAGAARRTLSRAKPLMATYLCLLLLVTAAGLVCLPFLLLAYLTGVRELVIAGVLASIVAGGAALGVFGLALPAVMLEHRSATEAIERAWGLSRLRPWTAAFIGASVVVGGSGLTIVLSLVAFALQKNAGDNQLLQFLGGLLTGVGPLFLDVAWSSILVTAYHGLVAEEGGVVGRASR